MKAPLKHGRLINYYLTFKPLKVQLGHVQSFLNTFLSIDSYLSKSSQKNPRSRLERHVNLVHVGKQVKVKSVVQLQRAGTTGIHLTPTISRWKGQWSASLFFHLVVKDLVSLTAKITKNKRWASNWNIWFMYYS